ncbi:MAG: hypothetical protein MRJ65_03940 [Candidatus Brocadiaceae bacterium]|nr:hypothetical protein [Candidatus Brocadiaceae bacterium]
MNTKDLELRFDNRKGPDFWIKSIRWFVVISWLLMVTALLVFGAAIPGVEFYFERNFNLQLNSIFNPGLSRYIFYVMILEFFVSIIGLFAFKKRSRRKSDEYRIYLIFLCILSVCGIVIYFFLF